MASEGFRRLGNDDDFARTDADGDDGRDPRPRAFFEEGIRSDVIQAWRKQGMPGGVSPAEMFPFDRRVEMAPELLAKKWPDSPAGLGAFRREL